MRNVATETVLDAIANAEQAMRDSGIVAVGDICNTGDTLSQKQQYNLRYHHFVEAIGVSNAIAGERFRQAEDRYRLFAELDPGRASIAPHAPYSVSRDLLALIDQFDTKSLLTIHNQESAAEQSFFLSGDGPVLDLYKAIQLPTDDIFYPGISPMQYLLPRLSREHDLLLVHNVITTEQDLQWWKTHQSELPRITWCLCPNANLYISGSLPDIALIDRYSDRLAIGTDSLASNRQLDILAELRTIQQHFPEIPLEKLLRWATHNGAKALRMDDSLGSFEQGKMPGLVLIENLDDDRLHRATSKRIL